MLNRFIIISLLTFPLMVFGGARDITEAQEHLQIIDQDRWGEVRIAPGVDLSKYTHLQIHPVTVEFREHWVRDQRRRDNTRVSERELERIKTDLAKQVHDAITRQWGGEDGYILTTESGESVMRVSARVTDLDIIAPNRIKNYIGESLAESLGNMTLELDIHDSSSGDLLVISWQYEEDFRRGYFEVSNSATLHQAFRLMLHRWTAGLQKSFENAGVDQP